MQALYAHVMMYRGALIAAINAQGHPDIRARQGDLEILVQVKSVAHRSANTTFELSHDDLAGISSAGKRLGVLSVLDCAEPPRWSVILRERAKSLVARPVNMMTLRAISDPAISAQSTEIFGRILSANESNLRNLDFNLLCARALRGEAI